MSDGKWLLSLLLVSAVFLSGCINQQTQVPTGQLVAPQINTTNITNDTQTNVGKDPSKLFIEYLDKSANLNKAVKLDYEIEMSGKTGSIITDLVGAQSIYAYQNKFKALTNLSTIGEKAVNKSEDYLLPEGQIACEKKILGGYECWEYKRDDPISELFSIDPVKSVDLTKAWLKDGSVTVTFLGKDKLNDKECDKFLLNMDVGKLLKNITQTYSVAKGDANYTVTECLDSDGVALFFDIDFLIKNLPAIGGRPSFSEIGMNVKYKIKDYDFYVFERDVALPIPLKEVKWLPKFEVTKAECLNEKIGVQLKATKQDFKPGIVKLNITYFPYNTVIEDYEVKNILDEANFNGINKGESGEIIFIISEDLNKIVSNKVVYESLFILEIKLGDEKAYSTCTIE